MKAILQRLLLVLIASTIASGCAANRVILHPIDKQDLVKLEKGLPYSPDRQGYFVSDFFMKEVMDAKVEKVRKDS